MPNAPVNPIPPEQMGGFLNDMIARALAGVAQAGRPLFLKIAYSGPAAMEELVKYDRHLVPGILGGSAGTTFDAFRLLEDARAHGARAALFGRKINNAEHQLSFIQFLRWIADGEVGADDAVRGYHGVLQGLGIRPHRTLEQDMRQTDQALGYGGSSKTISIPRSPGASAATGSTRTETPNPSWPTRPDGIPDFKNMTPDQRLAYHQARLNSSME